METGRASQAATLPTFGHARFRYAAVVMRCPLGEQLRRRILPRIETTAVNGDGLPVSWRFAVDALTFASRRTSCADDRSPASSNRPSTVTRRTTKDDCIISSGNVCACACTVGLETHRMDALRFICMPNVRVCSDCVTVIDVYASQFVRPFAVFSTFKRVAQ